jgi:competence protein ComEA
MFKQLITIVACLVASAAMAAVDVNKASESDLNGLSGVGPATSQLIMTERKKGEFKDWPDLMKRVKGIGQARATKLSAAGLTVGGASYPGTPSASKASAAKTSPMTPAAVKPAENKPVETTGNTK